MYGKTMILKMHISLFIHAISLKFLKELLICIPIDGMMLEQLSLCIKQIMLLQMYTDRLEDLSSLNKLFLEYFL